MEPGIKSEKVDTGTLLTSGKMICRGFLPYLQNPRTFTELYEYEGDVYIIFWENITVVSSTSRSYKIGPKLA